MDRYIKRNRYVSAAGGLKVSVCPRDVKKASRVKPVGYLLCQIRPIVKRSERLQKTILLTAHFHACSILQFVPAITIQLV